MKELVSMVSRCASVRAFQWTNKQEIPDEIKPHVQQVDESGVLDLVYDTSCGADGRPETNVHFLLYYNHWFVMYRDGRHEVHSDESYRHRFQLAKKDRVCGIGKPPRVTVCFAEDCVYHGAPHSHYLMPYGCSRRFVEVSGIGGCNFIG